MSCCPTPRFDARMKGAHLETSEATSVTIVSQQLLTRLDRGDFVMRIAGAGGCWAEDEGPRVPLIQCQVAHCLRSGKTEHRSCFLRSRAPTPPGRTCRFRSSGDSGSISCRVGLGHLRLEMCWASRNPRVPFDVGHAGTDECRHAVSDGRPI